MRKGGGEGKRGQGRREGEGKRGRGRGGGEEGEGKREGRGEREEYEEMKWEKQKSVRKRTKGWEKMDRNGRRRRRGLLGSVGCCYTLTTLHHGSGSNQFQSFPHCTVHQD